MTVESFGETKPQAYDDGLLEFAAAETMKELLT